MSLVQNVETLEREADELELRCAEREAEVRAPALAVEAELARVKAMIAEEESRLSAFTADFVPAPARVVLTPMRSLLAGLSVGAFTFGAAAGNLGLTKASVGLLAAVWVAFLAGALRGK